MRNCSFGGSSVESSALGGIHAQASPTEISGLSQQYLSGLEQGKRNPTIVTLFEIATALGVSHVELVTPD